MTSDISYRTVVFLDSNVVLEARELAELPWSEIDPLGPILLMATPTLLREVDSKKRDGRLATRARAFNRMLVPLTQGSAVVPVVQDKIIVDLGVASCRRIDWDQLDELDPTQGDDRIIAEVISAKLPPCDAYLFISQDLRPLLTAARYGIVTRHLGNNWLPKPEPSPQEKEVARLKQRVREFESAEPKFEVAFRLDSEQPISLVSVLPLAEGERQNLIKRAIDRNPCPEQRHGELGLFRFDYDSSLQSRYDAYVEKTLPEFFANYESKLELEFNQRLIRLSLKNTGRIQAEKLRVEVQVVGGWVASKPVIVPIYGPSPPRPRSMLNTPSFHGRLMNHRVGRHEFDLGAVDRQEYFVAECEDFRHGSEWVFEGALWFDVSQPRDSLVLVTITASNRVGEVVERFPVSKVVKTVAVEELVSFDVGYVKEPAVMAFVQRAVDRKDYSAFTLDSVEDENR